jgi:ABC-2 type transport system ATP-binding protein
MIKVAQISKSYQRKLVLDNISLEVPKGQIFGLLGPNGAGKTTLIRMLNQMLSPDAGSIYFDGQLLQASHLQQIGYLPEERGLYKSMGVRAHLLFLAQLRGLTKQDAAHHVDHWLAHFEIQDWQNKRIATLSKGMAQKVQFIAALVHQPQLLILDEPLSGFDPLNVELIMNEIKALKEKGTTIILSTHNMKSVDEICDHAALLHQGKLLAQDAVLQLRQAHAKGRVFVRFKGNMLSFANALWTDFTLLEQKERSEGVFECILQIRGASTVNDLMRSLQASVEVEHLELLLPSMQEVFVDLITQKETQDV